MCSSETDMGIRVTHLYPESYTLFWDVATFRRSVMIVRVNLITVIKCHKVMEINEI